MTDIIEFIYNNNHEEISEGSKLDGGKIIISYELKFPSVNGNHTDFLGDSYYLSSVEAILYIDDDGDLAMDEHIIDGDGNGWIYHLADDYFNRCDELIDGYNFVQELKVSKGLHFYY